MNSTQNPPAKKSLTVSLEIQNDTNHILTKTEKGKNQPYYDYFPLYIHAKEASKPIIELKSDVAIKATVTYQSSQGNIEIRIHKTSDTYKSDITALAKKDLVEQVNTIKNDDKNLSSKVIIGESLVIAAMHNLYNFLNELRDYMDRNQVVMGGSNLFDMIHYNKARQIFNRRIQLKPYAIVYCKSTEEVRRVFLDAKKNNLPIRVRSGGHDHEGECSGTDTIVIDLSKIHHVRVQSDGIACIGPGNRFEKLTTALAENTPPVMIPHGTCATVGIAGFTFGGGWGPWTRMQGMCCEYLVGATIVLGDGTIKELSEDGDEQSQKLLWALRGGGGFSYGIVTELRIQTFELPETLIRFDVEWNPYVFSEKGKPLFHKHKEPTINVLTAWEKVINYYRDQNIDINDPSPNKQLTGTNLKISAINRPVTEDEFKPNEVYHNAIMYGYWNGTSEALEAFIEASFGKNDDTHYKFTITGYGGANSEKPYGLHMMGSNWDRISFSNVKRLLEDKPLLGRSHGEPFPPDFDNPAPHKITCRLVDACGLGNEGHQALLRSLTSPMILNKSRELGLFSYVTLGAFSGEYYQNKKNTEHLNSAFPYKDKQYTIQYQTWWNEDLAKKEEGQDNKVYNNTNRALDWMEVARDFEIPNTSGSFISFKDNSIPTKTYFSDSYDELKRIKIKYSEDKFNHFRSRKTIL